MSAHVMPPDNDEIVIKPDNDVTIGNQTTSDVGADNKLNPDALGTVKSLTLSHTVRGVDAPISGVTGVRLPYGDATLEIVKKIDGTAQWKLGNAVLTAYSTRTERKWPSELDRPSSGTNNTNVAYTTAADPLAAGSTWSRIPFSEFTSFKLKTSRPA